jgi:hypothetical protein
MHRASIMCGLAAVVVLSAATSQASAQVTTITQWDFNSATGTTTPNIGVGTASLAGGTTATFASGVASGGSSDPTVGSPPNFGWNLTGFTAQGTGNETAGADFRVSTSGFQNITVSWDQRHSNTASRFVALLYTLDGTNFIKFNLGPGNSSPGTTPAGGNPPSTAGLYGGDGTFAGFDASVTGAGDDWFNGRSADLSSIVGANNNSNFGVRILSSFGGTAGYEAATTYASTGTWRFDMVTISGTSTIPEPTSIALVGLALGGFAIRRRFR